ncbi:copper resistance system multicopper oxidase [Rhodothermus marinus]|uniref:Copper-resistance protein, CopA family n=1 Tax=Rhodothermus marinus (strain ATCC 43812 / DSM 4252 / R-10) TaxID=518766 RepID=D0MIF6_RHOM4|nr:copper resistance system multicopper oxidase [Rhodothermus marinus]ACY48264.1 copper-resistance protein, CopA family [Rhodothermus marinus DSM 4252]
MKSFTRRDFLQALALLGISTGIEALLPAYARSRPRVPAPRRPRRGPVTYDLTIAETPIRIGGRRAKATTINGTVPGPLLRFREGDEVIIRVTNRLKEDTSIHWHGVLVPFDMDGVPGVSFPGIKPGETFTYRFRLRQHGTYWYHSHSGLQEQTGIYGPLIIDPAEEPYPYDREYVIVLSDWTFENPYRVLARLRKYPGYYNFQRRTLANLFEEAREMGFWKALKDRLSWGRMRMGATDIVDITGATYTYLMNGHAPEDNWTALFRPGERVRLRFINAAAGSIFDVRIPGLPMTVIQADGQYVQAVTVDEFRIGIAETYDVIVEPKEEQAYTIFAESMDRSGYARGTLAPREGMEGPIPPLRKRPLRTHADMGMVHEGHEGHAGMPHEAMAAPTEHRGHQMPADTTGHHMHGGHDHHGGHAMMAGMMGGVGQPPGMPPEAQPHGDDTHGPGNAAVPMITRSRLHEPGVGLGEDGWRVLVYTDLKSLHPREDFRPPTREIELHLTGNMERFLWGIDGKTYSEAPEPIRLRYGERVRLVLVNDTMMEHPMHLHGMWMELENGHGRHIPRKHTILVKPAERLSVLITPDEPGPWVFHCHILYHMEMGMFRVFEVSEPETATRTSS